MLFTFEGVHSDFGPLKYRDKNVLQDRETVITIITIIILLLCNKTMLSLIFCNAFYRYPPRLSTPTGFRLPARGDLEEGG